MTVTTEAQRMAGLKLAAERITVVFEKVFDDFNEAILSAARECRNNDASTALHEISSAVHMMDIPYSIREALEIPHG